MSRLVIVRHGQASFLSEDYDRLSPLGWEQGRKLGAYWHRQGETWDRVIVGPRRRHRETWEAIAEGYGEARSELPVADPDPRWDEHHVDQLLDGEVENWATADTELERRCRAWQRAEEAADRVRTFQLFFMAVAERWCDGDPVTSRIETWLRFQERVLQALDHVCHQAGRGQSVLTITSAGPVGVVMQRALEVSDARALGLTWRIRNSSVASFLFRDAAFTLDQFNSLAHLSDPKDWTFR